MLPSHESLDRPGGFSRVRLLAPLRHRDFRLLWGGMCVSLVGDGIFLVAMAWQVYALSNAPTALSAVGGSGLAFALDAASFLASGAAVLVMRPRAHVPVEAEHGSIGAELAGGIRYVRRHVWLWGTFAAAAIAYLAFMGPTEVLLPFLVKNTLHGSAFEFGVVLAAGGLASLACAALMGQSDLPRKSITFIYVTWTVATFAVAGYGFSTSLWQVM